MCPILGQDINKPNNPSDGNPMLAVSVMTTSVDVVDFNLYVDIYDRAQYFLRFLFVYRLKSYWLMFERSRLPTVKHDALSDTRNGTAAYNEPLAYRIDLR